MPQTSSGFVFATLAEIPFLLTDSEIEEQSYLDRPEEIGGNPIVWETSLVSTSLEMLLYLSRYSVGAIEHNPLLKRINAYISNWSLEIFGIRDAQERRYEWAIKTLEMIRDGAPLFDGAGVIVSSLEDSSPEPGKGYDSRSYSANRGAAIVPAFQSSALGLPLRDRLVSRIYRAADAEREINLGR